MNNLENLINELSDNINTIQSNNQDIITNENLEQLNDLLDGTELASKLDPSFFYNILQKHKAQSEKILNEFYSQLETDIGLDSGTININYIDEIPYDDDNNNYKKRLESKYKILQNNIEILRTYIRSEREVLEDTINDMRNNERFATTLNRDYSEIYKYKYLRNWGIFLSILGGAYFFKKMK